MIMRKASGHLAMYNQDQKSIVSTSLRLLFPTDKILKCLTREIHLELQSLQPVDIPLGGQEFGAFLIVAE
jgi:hypothetical protein